MSGFQDPITIQEAINKIYNKTYMLPSIQRKFTWEPSQIELLFDSIMCGYPINSFMMWEVSDDTIKNNYKFYSFLQDYKEFFEDKNLECNTCGVPTFYAIIDGQQRLTSLYIGLRGSYAYKLPRKRWIKDEEHLPTRHLFLNLKKSTLNNEEDKKCYDFQFLTNDMEKNDENHFWFKVGDILTFKDNDEIKEYLEKNNLLEDSYARKTLETLRKKIFEEKLINYYLEDDQLEDKVLDIFIRTNSGGTPLSFSDLLMSISSANWKKYDARSEMEDVISKVHLIGNPNFMISKDFVLKTCLVLFSEDIKFQLKNFSAQNITLFENDWENVKKAIITSFRLLSNMGFDDVRLRAKNAVIPIIYYIYKNNLMDSILKPTYNGNDKNNIARWLNLSLLKSIFSGQTDTILSKIRKVIKNSKGLFPIQEIMDAFKLDPVRNYSLENDFIEGLLETQYGNNSFYILSLLCPQYDYSQPVHVDHMHPKSFFEKWNDEKDNLFRTEEERNFAKDANNWNSILNLQLLNGYLNEQKNDQPLKDWEKEHPQNRQSMFLNEDTSLDISDFKEFIETRKANLRKAILNLAKS